MKLPPAVDEGGAVAGDALEDEALAAEEAGPELLGEGDPHLDAGGGAQERVALAEPGRAAREVELLELAGVGRGEGDLALGAAAEAGHEEALARPPCA